MITRLCFFVLVPVTSLWLAGCSSDDHPDTSRHGTAARTAQHEKKSDDDDHDMSKPPHVGMSKAQVRAQYGEPHSRDVSDEGEVWGYRLNLGGALVAGLNPFDYGNHGRLRFGQIYFDGSGHVKRYHWDAGHSDE